MLKFCSYFDNPHQGKFRVVNVAGTNGKGSVTCKVAKGLQYLGFKVGMFTSPHVSSFRERFQINGECVSMENVVETMERIFSVV